MHPVGYQPWLALGSTKGQFQFAKRGVRGKDRPHTTSTRTNAAMAGRCGLAPTVTWTKFIYLHHCGWVTTTISPKLMPTRARHSLLNLVDYVPDGALALPLAIKYQEAICLALQVRS